MSDKTTASIVTAAPSSIAAQRVKKAAELLAAARRDEAALVVQEAATVEEAAAIADHFGAVEKLNSTRDHAENAERDAYFIKQRARRRLGQLTMLLPKAKPGRRKAEGSTSENPEKEIGREGPTVTKREVLERIGLAKQQCSDLEKLARIPITEFDDRAEERRQLLRLKRITEILLESGDFSDIESLREQALKVLRNGKPEPERSPLRNLGRPPTLGEMRSELDKLWKEAGSVRRHERYTERQVEAKAFLKATAGWAYIAESAAHGPLKIGFSRDPEVRMTRVRYRFGDRTYLLVAIPGGRPLERHLHKRFAAHRTEGEWFERGDDLLAFIRQNGGTA